MVVVAVGFTTSMVDVDDIAEDENMEVSFVPAVMAEVTTEASKNDGVDDEYLNCVNFLYR